MINYYWDNKFDYDKYKEAQEKLNKLKINFIWTKKGEIEKLSNYIKKQNPKVSFGICHGSRNGAEVKWFRHYLNAEVIGTDISSTATKFPDMIIHDMQEIKEEWVGKADFIYSNSFDHCSHPYKCMKTWLKTLNSNGRIYLHLRPGGPCNDCHDKLRPDDCFLASKEDYYKLIEECGGEVIEEYNLWKRRIAFVIKKNNHDKKEKINFLKTNNKAVIVNQKNKFLYLKIHKVAGTSIYRQVLKSKYGHDVFEEKYYPEKIKKWYALTIDKDLDSYFKFTFVRNPWDRIVSNYFYALKKHRISLSFEEFVEGVANETLNKDILIHSRPVDDYFLYNGCQYVDFIGRYETLSKDWKYVADKLNITEQLPMTNQTIHKDYKSYYKNDTIIDKVGQIFKNEIDYLGYKF